MLNTRIHTLVFATFLATAGAVSSAHADAFAVGAGKISASDRGSQDEFGFSLDLDADTLVVGARHNNDDGTHSGSAYVFSRNQGGANLWGQTRKLLALDAAPGDEFGYDVAVRGDLIIVGAPFHGAGAAYIYERDQGGNGTWGRIFRLEAVNGTADEEFGLSVDIDGDTCVVGAHLSDVAAGNGGAAYIFQRTGSGTSEWQQVRQITGVDTALNDEFGFDVAIDGDTVVVGAPKDNTGDPGSAYIFQRNQGGAGVWGQVKRIVAGNAGSGDEFGTSVAIHGDRIVVGAPYEDTRAFNAGSAYLFERNRNGANQWGQVRQLTADDGSSGEELGGQVAVHGDLVVVGAQEEDRTLLSNAGAAYLFFRDQGGSATWNQAQKLVAYDANGSDRLGSAVAVGPTTVMAGAKDDNGGATGSGSAYPFSLTYNNPPSIADQVFSIPENSPNATGVGAVAASPGDTGQTLGYSILSGNTGGAFAIGAGNGIISVANSNVLDHESIPQFVLEVQVVDNGSPPLANSAMVTINVSDIPENADVRVTKTASGSARAGDPLTYFITVENLGPLVATNVVVRDFLPAGTTPSGTVTNSVGNLASGQDFTFTVGVVVDPAWTGPLTNLVTATTDTPDVESDNNSFTLVTPITAEADLRVTKTAPALVRPGDPFVYTITVSNAGPSDAVNVAYQDTLPPGLTTSGTISNQVGTLPPGTVQVFQLPVQSDGVFIGELTNTVSLTSATADPDTTNDTAAVTTTVNYTADLGIGKSGPALVTDSDLVRYLIVVTNLGPDVAQNIVITDTLPPGMTFSPAGSDLLCSGGGSQVVCGLASLSPSGVAVLQIEGKLAPTATGTVVNVATVSSLSIDTNPANDAASAATLLPDFDGDGQADFADEDDDNDQIPDAWEIANGLNRYDAADAALDPDADGFTSFEEYVADTIPTDGMSFLSLSGISAGGVIAFESSSNRIYSLEYIGDLSAGAWLPVPGQTNLPGVGGTQLTTNSVPDPGRLYRLKAHPP